MEMICATRVVEGKVDSIWVDEEAVERGDRSICNDLYEDELKNSIRVRFVRKT